MIVKEKTILSDKSPPRPSSDKINIHRRNLMNTANSKSTLLNNSFTSNIQEKICNCLGCNELADTEISLKIGEKSITIIVCENCKAKFEN